MVINVGTDLFVLGSISKTKNGSNFYFHVIVNHNHDSMDRRDYFSRLEGPLLIIMDNAITILEKSTEC